MVEVKIDMVQEESALTFWQLLPFLHHIAAPDSSGKGKIVFKKIF